MEETKKSTYTEAQKRAIKKYRENNKEKVNEQRKIYYENRKERDPNFLVYKRNKANEYYQKKKADKIDKAYEEEKRYVDEYRARKLEERIMRHKLNFVADVYKELFKEDILTEVAKETELGGIITDAIYSNDNEKE